MSSSLYWREVPKEKEYEYLGINIKYHLAPKLWGHDGSLSSEFTTVGPELIPFLEGLISAGGEELSLEAQDLIKLIGKHGKVQIASIQ